MPTKPPGIAADRNTTRQPGTLPARWNNRVSTETTLTARRMVAATCLRGLATNQSAGRSTVGPSWMPPDGVHSWIKVAAHEPQAGRANDVSRGCAHHRRARITNDHVYAETPDWLISRLARVPIQPRPLRAPTRPTVTRPARARLGDRRDRKRAPTARRVLCRVSSRLVPRATPWVPGTPYLTSFGGEFPASP
jgi:hypothetical protein